MIALTEGNQEKELWLCTIVLYVEAQWQYAMYLDKVDTVLGQFGLVNRCLLAVLVAFCKLYH